MRADERNDLPAAAALLRRALALLPAGEPAVMLRLRLAAAIHSTEGAAAASACLVEGAKLAAAAGDHPGELRMRIAEVTARTWLAGTREGRGVVEEALPVLERAGDELGQALAWELVTIREHDLMHSGAKLAAAERMLEHARAAGARWLEDSALRWILGAHFWGPTPLNDAERIFEQHASIEQRFPTLMATHASLKGMLGRLAEGRAMLAAARTRAEELGGWNLGWGQQTWDLERYGGDFETAEWALRREFSGGEAAGELGFLSTTCCNLGDALYAQGRLEEAEHWAQRGRELCAADDVITEIRWRLVLAKLLARRSEQSKARQLAGEAIAVAETTDSLVTQADVHLGLAEVLELGGSREEAVGELERALELFERKGHVTGTAKARERLAELRAVEP
jgi:tetratricopeptide (TPR) repeat protein